VPPVVMGAGNRTRDRVPWLEAARGAQDDRATACWKPLCAKTPAAHAGGRSNVRPDPGRIEPGRAEITPYLPQLAANLPRITR